MQDNIVRVLGFRETELLELELGVVVRVNFLGHVIKIYAYAAEKSRGIVVKYSYMIYVIPQDLTPGLHVVHGVHWGDTPNHSSCSFTSQKRALKKAQKKILNHLPPLLQEAYYANTGDVYPSIG